MEQGTLAPLFAQTAEAGLGGLDLCVISVYLLGMLGVGIYYARRTRNADDYLLGGRRMRPTAVGLSLFATLLSTITYLAIPGEIIRNGPIVLAFAAAFPLVYVLAGWFMIPRIMRLPVTSAYELLETRLGPHIRMLASLFFLAMRLVWMAVIISATVNAVLLPLLDLPSSSAPWLCALLGLITVAYTAMGGLRAVVLTDVIQSLILFGGAVLTVAIISVKLGGPGAWWPQSWPDHWMPPSTGFAGFGSPQWAQENLFARMTFLSAAIYHFCWWICTASSDQMAVQRYLATRDARGARRALLTTLLTDAIVYFLLAAVGLALMAYFHASVDQLEGGATANIDADSLFPQFIAAELPAGLSGLVIAGLLAAAMSSLSSGVNSACSVVTADFAEPILKRQLEDQERIRLARRSAVAVGILVVALASLVSLVEGNLLEVAAKIVNLLTASLFGLFFLAMFVRRATPAGALIGTVCGLGVAVLVNFGKELTGHDGISFVWAMPFAWTTQVVVATCASPILARRRG